jgi:hypothetical protein
LRLARILEVPPDWLADDALGWPPGAVVPTEALHPSLSTEHVWETLARALDVREALDEIRRRLPPEK